MAKSGADKMAEEEMEIMKGHISALFTGRVPFKPPATFPQSHIIYAGSIRQANEIIEKGGYFVISSGDVEMYKASAAPDVEFKIATEGLTPVFSDLLGFKGENGCKTFFTKDYRKLRISLGTDGRTTDWILTKKAKKSSCMTSAVTAADDFTMKALAGTVTTSCLPAENDNYEEANPAEGWRKERKREREALKRSPAYIPGSLSTPAKKKERKGNKVREVMNEETKVEKVTVDKNIEEEAICMMKTKVKKVVEKQGGVKCSRYFAFVRKILEMKRVKRARQRESTTPTLPGGSGGESKTMESPEVPEPVHCKTLAQGSETAQPLRLRGGGMMGDSDDGSSSDEEGAYMSAAEELSLSPTPHNYETPAFNIQSPGHRERSRVEEEESMPREVISEERDVATGSLCFQPLRLRGGCGEMDGKELDTDEGEGPEERTDDNSAFTGRIELSSKFSMEVHQDMQAERENQLETHEPPIDDLDDSKTYGYKCLEKIDGHFVESPRLIVCGIWRGETMELVARRKPEGTLVEWTITERRFNKKILLVKARMMYKSYLRPSSKYGSDLRSYGYRVMGGWAWSGYGYGFVNVFPSSDRDQSIKHIDLEEAVLPNENQYHHVSGPECKLDENTDVCNEAGCGVRIWSLSIKSYTTDVHEPQMADVKVYNKKRSEQKEHIWLSLVVFQSTGMYRMLLHRDGPDRTYRCVAWMTKVNEFFRDDPEVDECILARHKYIWSTELPKKVPDQNRFKSGTIIIWEKKRDDRGEDALNAAEGEENICKRRLRTQETSENPIQTDVQSEALQNINEIPIVHSQTGRQLEGPCDPLYDLERALRESRKTKATTILQGEMVEQGIQIYARLGLSCQAHTSFIPPDGDCLWSCFARSRNCKLKDEILSAEAFSLRMMAVSKAIEVITNMDENSFEEVLKFTETATREELIDEITKYMQSGTYSGKMGDLLPYIGASFLGQPLLIVVLTKDGPYCTYADPSFDKFGGQEEVQCPCVTVQSGNHYEDLLLRGESKEGARKLFIKLKNGATTALNTGSESFHFSPMFVSTPCDNNSQLAEPCNRPAEALSQSGEAPSQSGEALSQPVETQSQPAENPSHPAENPSQPAENQSQPAENHSQPAENLSQKAENPGLVERIGSVCCETCSKDIRDLIDHLNESTECLGEYARNHLPRDFQDQEVEHRLSLFRISLVLGVCARPHCTARNDKYLGPHLKRHVDCLEFYQSEAISDSSPWSSASTAPTIGRKVKEMKRKLKETIRKEDGTGVTSFKEELSRLLSHVCCKCGRLGPIGDDDSSEMACAGFQGDVIAWRCGACSPDSSDYGDVKRRLVDRTNHLSKANGGEENLLKVVINQKSNQTVLALPQIESDFLEPEGHVDESWSCEVLVPSEAPSIKAILHICEDALQDKKELDDYVTEISKRPFITKIDATLSVLFRSKLADIKKTMDRLLYGLSKVARGEILSVNPNHTNAVKINPHLGMTIQGALQDHCPWSTPYKEQRILESAARTNVHGYVKTFLKCTILNGLEDAELQRIFITAAQAYGQYAVVSFEELDQSFALKMTPIVVNYLHSKIKLFIKHIIIPNYTNHDLTLQFSRDCWAVQIVGYVYSKEFKQVNCEIARNPQLLSTEIINRILEKHASLPTVTLDWEQLACRYRIDEAHAKDIIARVKRYQLCKEASPLSALDMWTGQQLFPTDAEEVLRARAILLSQQVDAGDDQEAQILYVARTLLEEGGLEDLEIETVDKNVIQDMKNKLYNLNPQSKSLNAQVWYHTLLFKTGKYKSWTLKRKCGETKIAPYHPLLVEATNYHVKVETVIGGDYIKYEDAEEVPGPWREVNILEFLYSVRVKKSDSYLASSTTVNVVATPHLEHCFLESTERDEEVDDIFVNMKNESYIVSNGDLAKLYSKRPEGVEAMTFAEFSTEYYIDRWGNHAIIDPETGLGGESEDVIVGGRTLAPLFMQLVNRKVMKKRVRAEKGKPVPLLMHNNTLDDYGERLLFKPWRSKEELINGISEAEKSRCRQVRLQLFPMGVFPS